MVKVRGAGRLHSRRAFPAPAPTARRLEDEHVAFREGDRDLRRQTTPLAVVHEEVPSGPTVRAAVQAARREDPPLREDRRGARRGEGPHGPADAGGPPTEAPA